MSGTTSVGTKARTDLLDVWTPSFEVPRKLIDGAKRYSLKCAYGGKAHGAVNTGNLFNLPTLIVDGYCQWHNDAHMPSEYSGLLIVRNDIDSWVEVKNQPIIKEQPVGTIVTLRIFSQHRLNAIKSRFCRDGVWVAIPIDSKKVLSRDAWEERFKSYLKEVS